VSGDPVQRRSRTEPQSTGKRVTPQPRDLLWFEKLHEHGPLPSFFLLDYAKDTHKSEKRAKERLTDLFNENRTPDGGPYLSRPPQQFRTIDSRYNSLVYDLTISSRKALQRSSIANQAGNTNAGPWLHRHMVACITASIELACIEQENISYISQHEILKRADTELRYPTTITEPSGSTYIKDLIPDALFGLCYHTSDGDRFRFYMVEADRATEPATSKNFNRKSVLRNLLQYQDYIENGLYRDHLQLSSPLLVLNIVPDAKRMAQMLKLVGNMMPDGCSYQLFQTWEDFGAVFKPPVPNPAFLIGDWERAIFRPFNGIMEM